VPLAQPPAGIEVDDRDVAARQLRREAAAIAAWSPRWTGAHSLHDALAAERDLFGDCAAALIGTDLTGVVAYWNAEAERLYGWSAGEAIGRPVQTLVVAHDDRELSMRILRSICWTGSWEGEFWVRRKDHSTFRAHVLDIVVEDDEGIPIAVFGLSRDSRREPGER
jgi:PAS domain S-box-containing protein